MTYAETMRAVLTSPDSQESEKQEAIASLKRLADVGNDSAKAVLAELGFTGNGLAASTGDGHRAVSTYDVLGGFVEDDPLSSSLPARHLATNSSPRYDPHTKRWADECQRSKERGEISNIYRYWLPRLYQDLYSNPRERAGVPGEVFADYLPYKWLTWELFVEMQEALMPDSSKSCFEQVPIATRVAPYIDRWRKIKNEWEATHGPTRECLSDVLFDPYTDCPEARNP